MKVLKYAIVVLIVLGGAAYAASIFWGINPPVKVLAHDYTGALPLERLQIADDLKVTVYAEEVIGARSMSLSPSGVLYVGTRDESVYALVDKNKDGVAETHYTLLQDGNMPNGVAYRNGDLYVAEVSRILVFRDIESKLDNPGMPEVIKDDYPTETHHGWKYIAFGPDDKLYVPVGAPCNICESDEIYASITRIDPDGSNLEIVQHGVRNTVGFTWHPKTGDLWFTDNGRDMMGDDIPACEVNHASEPAQHFGYPYCHQGDLLDPEFGDGRSCGDYRPPALRLGAHVAPLGIEIYDDNYLPAQYKGRAIWAEHGSWNRSKKSGYRVMMADIDDNNKMSNYQPLIKGWLNDDTQEVWGRPVDIEPMSDGSLLISDDFADAIYRVYLDDSQQG